MSAHKLSLHELCYPGIPYTTWTHNASPKLTSQTSHPTLMERCYPDIHYVSRKAQQFPSNHLIECQNNLDLSTDHSNTDSEFLWSDTDPAPIPLDFNTDYEQKISKVKEDIAALLKIKHQDP